MATGANRGAWYAGFMGPLAEAGIDFELLAGVSAGGIASSWFAAGDPESYIDSWRRADPYRIAVHPWLSLGRRRTVDSLIESITLKTMDLAAARTSTAEVKMTAARIVGPGFPLPRFEMTVFSNRQAKDDEQWGRMLRATAFVPWINGLRGAITIGVERYMDGGLVNRTPLEIVPEGVYDELWIAACSPSGFDELVRALPTHRRQERLVVITPGEELPAGRWTMDWGSLSRTIEQGRRDMSETIERVADSQDSVAIGRRAGELERAMQAR